MDDRDKTKLKREFREMLKAVLLGLVVWAVASVAIGSYYGFALAVFVSSVYLGDLNARRLNEALEELNSKFNALRENVARLDENLIDAAADLEARAEGFEKELSNAVARLDNLESKISGSQEIEKRLLGTDFATEAQLERAVEAAIRETRATSPKEMGLVIKTARGQLKGKRFAEQQLRDLVRSRLRQ